MSAQLIVPFTSSITSSNLQTVPPLQQDRLTELALVHLQQREWKRAIACLDDKMTMCAHDNNESGRALFLRGRCLWNHAIEDWQKAARLGNTEAQTQLSVLIRSLEHEKLRPRLLSRLAHLQERLRFVPSEIVDIFRELHQIDQGSPPATANNAIAQLRETVDAANAVLLDSLSHLKDLSASTPLPTTSTSNSDDENSSMDSLTSQLSVIETQLGQARQAQQLLQKSIQETIATTTTSSSFSSVPNSRKDDEHNNVRRICYEALSLEVRRKRREQESASRLVMQARQVEQQIESALIPQMQSLLRDLAQTRVSAERTLPHHPTPNSQLARKDRKRPTEDQGTNSNNHCKRRKTM